MSEPLQEISLGIWCITVGYSALVLLTSSEGRGVTDKHFHTSGDISITLSKTMEKYMRVTCTLNEMPLYV